MRGESSVITYDSYEAAAYYARAENTLLKKRQSPSSYSLLCMYRCGCLFRPVPKRRRGTRLKSDPYWLPASREKKNLSFKRVNPCDRCAPRGQTKSYPRYQPRVGDLVQIEASQGGFVGLVKKRNHASKWIYVEIVHIEKNTRKNEFRQRYSVGGTEYVHPLDVRPYVPDIGLPQPVHLSTTTLRNAV